MQRAPSEQHRERERFWAAAPVPYLDCVYTGAELSKHVKLCPLKYEDFIAGEADLSEAALFKKIPCFTTAR